MDYIFDIIENFAYIYYISLFCAQSLSHVQLFTSLWTVAWRATVHWVTIASLVTYPINASRTPQLTTGNVPGKKKVSLVENHCSNWIANQSRVWKPSRDESPAMNIPSQQSRAWLLLLWIHFNSLNGLSHLQSSEAYLPKCTWVLWKGWQPSILESWDSLLAELCDVLNLEIEKVVVAWSVTHRGTGWGAEGNSGLWTAFVQHEVIKKDPPYPPGCIFRVRDCSYVQFAGQFHLPHLFHGVHWLDRMIFSPVASDGPQPTTVNSGWGVVFPRTFPSLSPPFVANITLFTDLLLWFSNVTPFFSETIVFKVRFHLCQQGMKVCLKGGHVLYPKLLTFSF